MKPIFSQWYQSKKNQRFLAVSPLVLLLPFFVITLLSGVNDNEPVTPDQQLFGYSSKIVNGSTTTYMWPTYLGEKLGWDGVSSTQYFVADCFCISMGHTGYQQAIPLNPATNSYSTYYPPNGSGWRLVEDQALRPYKSVSCNGGL